MSQETSHKSYPVFRGLQLPLEFMGLQGRYIAWAAATFFLALIFFVIIYMVSSSILVGLIVLVSIIAAGAILIMVKMSKGLHSKKNQKGLYIYSHIKHI